MGEKTTGEVNRINEAFPKETPENREFFRIIKKTWPSLNELKGATRIKLMDEGHGRNHIEEKVEEYLDKQAPIKNQRSQKASISTIANDGIFGGEERVYEIENEGKIKYLKANTPFAFAAEITLIGFDKRRKIFRKLESDLIRVANLKPNTRDYFLTAFYGINPKLDSKEKREEAEKLINRYLKRNS